MGGSGYLKGWVKIFQHVFHFGFEEKRENHIRRKQLKSSLRRTLWIVPRVFGSARRMITNHCLKPSALGLGADGKLDAVALYDAGGH